MADPFQPSDAKGTETATPSPAAQARAKYNADILGKILEFAAGRQRPSFAQYAQGASMPGALPPGLSAGIPDLLAVMNQPGAFTATKTGTLRLPGTSLVSDIAQALDLGAQIYNSGLLGAGATGVTNLYDWFRNKMTGAPNVPGSSDQIGFTPDPLAGTSAGMSMDPSFYENQDLGMSIDPNADPLVLQLLGLGY